MAKFSMLEAWLMRKDTLSSFIDLENNPPNLHSGFLTLDEILPLHKAITLTPESLSESWYCVHNYVDRALKIISSDTVGWLDSEEAAWILEELGSPPNLCYPLYIISVGKGADERIVYIGKTSSTNGRFRNGHKIFAMLHAPEYDGLAKNMYLGGVVLLADNGEYQPLEWVKPLSKAEELLTSIEAQLIFQFKPELNTHHKNHYNAKYPLVLHIENHETGTNFLHGATL